MHKKLIINADDFGMSKEVNEGTKLAIQQGLISSVSLMSNMPFFEDAVMFLKKYPKVSIGLHFNLTEGKSIVMPSVVTNLIREDDAFYHWPQLITRVLLKQIDRSEIEEELKAQYTKLAKTGLPISHIDSHHHIHLYPFIFEIVSGFANKHKISSLRGNYFDMWNLTLGNLRRPIPTQILVNVILLLNNIKSRNQKHLYETNRFYDINWGKDITIEEFITILKKLPEGTTEFICHLAIESKNGNKKFLAPRYKVYKLLSHRSVRKHLIHNGIKLVPRTF